MSHLKSVAVAADHPEEKIAASFNRSIVPKKKTQRRGGNLTLKQPGMHFYYPLAHISVTRMTDYIQVCLHRLTFMKTYQKLLIADMTPTLVFSTKKRCFFWTNDP